MITDYIEHFKPHVDCRPRAYLPKTKLQRQCALVWLLIQTKEVFRIEGFPQDRLNCLWSQRFNRHADAADLRSSIKHHYILLTHAGRGVSENVLFTDLNSIARGLHSDSFPEIALD